MDLYKKGKILFQTSSKDVLYQGEAVIKGTRNVYRVSWEESSHDKTPGHTFFDLSQAVEAFRDGTWMELELDSNENALFLLNKED